MARIEIKNGYAHYPCGCKFKVLDIGPPIRLEFNPRVEYIPFDCPSTWELFAEGNTKGVFQLETRFGQQYSKKLKPENIEQLAALTSILRPGCVQALRDGKNVAEHYIDRKNRQEEITYVHPALEPILKDTYGEMIYQEQAMRIAQDIAGFDLKQADILRKAIGKKKADIMAKVKQEFLNGCKAKGIIDEAMAEELFGWIEKSQRYSFNKSHAISYAINGYISAYAKVHFPLSFFVSYLYFSKDKQDKFGEVKLLIANAKTMNIHILPPDFRHTNKHFQRISDNTSKECSLNNDKIYFGFADIKGIGDSSITKLNTAIYQIETALGKHRKDWTWLEFLIYFSQEVNSTTIIGMIESGALDYMNVNRQQMLFEFEEYSKLTSKELAWIRQYAKPTDKDKHLVDILAKMISWYEILKPDIPKPCANKNRHEIIKNLIKLLQSPPYSLNDSADWIARVEEARLGISLTASNLDACKNLDQANCTCRQFLNHDIHTSAIFIAAQIDNVKEHLTKNSDPMAFVTLSDNEGSIDAVIFPDCWEAIRQSGICVEENTVMVSGDRSRQNPDSLIIKKMWQLT